jgi:iron complex outermembrane receptor protein
MKQIIETLLEGKYSCVIKNGGEVRTFSNRGVIDLYNLFLNEPEFLKGAVVADKIVGKAAASLMVLGKVRELYASLISTSALRILKENNIKASFGAEVPVILNRSQSDWCPLEILCFEENSAYNILNIIRDFTAKVDGR